jgi:hypothetical protein
MKFVGRRILHKWETDVGQEEWYSGIVIGVSRGKDGNKDAVYQVQYKNENDIYDVEELYKDYEEGNLRFDDL